MQDSRSALWLGTIDDVYCFDGEHFYSLRGYGFPKETPNSFAEDSEGGIWIGTQGTDAGGGNLHGGIYRYSGGHVERMLSGDNLSIVAISPSLILASTGTESVGKPTYGDLVMFQETAGRWVPQLLLTGQVDHMTVDHGGNVLFPCPGGWCELAGKTLASHKLANGILDVRKHSGSPLLERVLRDRFGCLWFRAEAFASYQCPADKEVQPIDKLISQYDSSDHLEETEDGSIFMLVAMVLGRPGSFHTVNDSNAAIPGLGTATVARDGTIWIGSQTGLYRFPYPFHLELWDSKEGAIAASSIVRNKAGVFASAGQINRLDEIGGHWTPIAAFNDRGGVLARGPGDTLFTATLSSVSHIRADGKMIAQSGVDNPPRFPKASLASTPDGDFWLGQAGLSHGSERQGRLNLHSENLPHEGIADIRYDAPHGTLWVCDGYDLFYRRNGAWAKLTQADGLLQAKCHTIAIQSNGDVWIGYEAEAVGWISNSGSAHPTIRNYTDSINEVVANNAVHLLAADRRDWLWRGMAALYLAGPAGARENQWLRLDAQDGVPEVLVDSQAFLADPDGSVWFSTDNGIVHFSPPPDFAIKFPSPPIFVSGFSFAGNSPTLANATSPLPHDSEVAAHIGSLQFDRRNALHFRYRLLPGQPEWKETDSFDLPLGKLRPGRHTLEVQGRMLSGEWSGVERASFKVLWPVWLSWPALLLVGAGGTSVAAGVHEWRKRQRFRREVLLPDISAWRMSALSPETEHLVGTAIDGRYEIGHILSIGGFATVARARDLRDGGKLCAVKIFRYELGDQAWIRHRFEQEVTALEQLSHPNIVKITGHGTVDTGAPYLVMEFIHGRTLREVLTPGALPRKQTALFLGQIASALEALHRASIFHRDLKPENLIVRAGEDDGQQIVLIDFSIAIVKSADQTFHGISRVAGTLDYMAPEQVIGYADASTDIYSLAKILVEMLTGLRWTELLPEATLDLPEQLRAYFKKHQELLAADSVDLLIAALAFDPVRRPKGAVAFAGPIIRDLERSPSGSAV